MQLNGPNDTRLAPFLGLAALLHAVVIGLVPLGQNARAPLHELHLALARPAAAPASAGPAPRADRRPAESTAAPAPAHAAALPAAPAESPATPLAAAPAAEEAAARGETSARVIAQVRAALSRYFAYPMTARRHGWEGEVLLGFSVTREGRIAHVEVVRSSGYRLLDEAALASLAQVGNLPDYTARDDEPLRLKVPVVYRLEG